MTAMRTKQSFDTDHLMTASVMLLRTKFKLAQDFGGRVVCSNSSAGLGSQITITPANVIVAPLFYFRQENAVSMRLFGRL